MFYILIYFTRIIVYIGNCIQKLIIFPTHVILALQW